MWFSFMFNLHSLLSSLGCILYSFLSNLSLSILFLLIFVFFSFFSLLSTQRSYSILFILSFFLFILTILHDTRMRFIQWNNFRRSRILPSGQSSLLSPPPSLSLSSSFLLNEKGKTSSVSPHLSFRLLLTLQSLLAHRLVLVLLIK